MNDEETADFFRRAVYIVCDRDCDADVREFAMLAFMLVWFSLHLSERQAGNPPPRMRIMRGQCD